MKSVEHAHAVFDALYEGYAQAANRRGYFSSCRAGCFACCKEPTYLDRREVIHMLEQLSEQEIAEVREQTKAWAERILGTRLLGIAEPNVIEYRVQNLWCPMLKDGLCRAWEHRPMTCRNFTAVGPRELCQSEDTRMAQTFLLQPEPMQAGAAALYGSSDRNISIDHLGAHLCQILLGVRLESAARIEAVFQGRQTQEAEAGVALALAEAEPAERIVAEED